VFFPPWDREAFAESRRETHAAADGPAFAFASYRRR
jgi:hypothetical protein